MNLDLKNKIAFSIERQFSYYGDNGYIDLLELYSTKKSINFKQKIANVIIEANINQIDLYEYDNNLGVGNYPINEIIMKVVYKFLKELIKTNMGGLDSVFDNNFLKDDWALHREIRDWLDRYQEAKND